MLHDKDAAAVHLCSPSTLLMSIHRGPSRANVSCPNVHFQKAKELWNQKRSNWSDSSLIQIYECLQMCYNQLRYNQSSYGCCIEYNTNG